MPKTSPGRWGQNQMATHLGFTSSTWSLILAGQIYPARLQQLQRIEIVLGWSVSEQVKLIPPYWEWPEHASKGKPAGEPTDMRYAIKLARVVAEWADANPRTVPTREVQMHPSLVPYNGVHRNGWYGEGNKPGVRKEG